METSEARVFLILSADQSVLTSSTGQPNSYYLELENGNESSSMNRKTCREACSSRCNFSSVYQMKVIICWVATCGSLCSWSEFLRWSLSTLPAALWWEFSVPGWWLLAGVQETSQVGFRRWHQDCDVPWNAAALCGSAEILIFRCLKPESGVLSLSDVFWAEAACLGKAVFVGKSSLSFGVTKALAERWQVAWHKPESSVQVATGSESKALIREKVVGTYGVEGDAGGGDPGGTDAVDFRMGENWQSEWQLQKVHVLQAPFLTVLLLVLPWLSGSGCFTSMPSQDVERDLSLLARVLLLLAKPKLNAKLCVSRTTECLLAQLLCRGRGCCCVTDNAWQRCAACGASLSALLGWPQGK